ncbi:UDP-N-acetylglucosamine 2-epimerase, partial [Candidatus Thiomargarita nelsonii]
MKIVTIIGARPQFIKAATVSRVIETLRTETPSGKVGIEEVLVHTGQHYDAAMSKVFFTELAIPEPHYNLGIGGGLHGEMTGRQLEAIEKVLLDEQPDWVLVYGDTNSTLAGALAAVKLHIPVAHVEAGLRSFNRRMPEEINRVLTDHASDLLFAPTKNAVYNLKTEGISSDEHVKLVGDVMYDAALFYADKAERQSQILEQLGLTPKAYSLITIHRAENTDNEDHLSAIVDALIALSDELPVVLPLHPRTNKQLEQLGLLDKVHNALRVIEPIGYLDMVMLEKQA